MSRSLDVHLFLETAAASLETQTRGKTVVAIDILRATTTLTVAFANGLRLACPVLTPEEAHERRAGNFPEALLGGERHGLRIDGFDLGNSPREYTRAAVSGRELVMTTTNGTRLLRACASASRIVIGSFANLNAVCRSLRETNGDILLACAGTEGRFSIEDGLFAGACAAMLRADGFALSDSAVMVAAMWDTLGEVNGQVIAEGRHGRSLARLGLSEDLPACAQRDTTDLVPEVRNVDSVMVVVLGSP